MLIQAALHLVEERSQQAQSELQQLGSLGRQLDDKRREAEQEATILKGRQAELTALIERRQTVYRQTDDNRKAAEIQADKIAMAAHDLRDLVGRVDFEKTPAAISGAKRPAPSPQGEFILAKNFPVAGPVRIRFGQNDGLGATSHGLTLAPRPGATVTAPAAGVVRFAGPFRGYRQILILEHSAGYHSLLAGMAKVNVAPGASVGAGEPVGVMDDRPELQAGIIL